MSEMHMACIMQITSLALRKLGFVSSGRVHEGRFKDFYLKSKWAFRYRRMFALEKVQGVRGRSFQAGD